MEDSQYLDPTKLNSGQLRSVLSKYGVVLNTTAQNKSFLLHQYKQHDIAGKIKEQQAEDITRKKIPHKRTIEMVDGDRTSPKRKRRKSSISNAKEEKKMNLPDLMQYIPKTTTEDIKTVKPLRPSPSTRATSPKKGKRDTLSIASPLHSLIPSLPKSPEFPPSPKKEKRRKSPAPAPVVIQEFPPSPKKGKRRSKSPRAKARPIRSPSAETFYEKENQFQPLQEPIHIHVPTQYVNSKSLGHPKKAAVPRRRKSKSKSPRYDPTSKGQRKNEEFYKRPEEDEEEEEEEEGNGFFFLLLKLLAILCILAALFFVALFIANYQPLLPYCEAGAYEKANVCKKCPTNGICTPGTFRCNCPMGYIVSNDGSNCIPDESIPLLADKLTTQYLQPLLRKRKGEYECNQAYSPELSKDEVDSMLRETYKSLAPGDAMMNDYLLAYRHILNTLDSHQIYRIVDHRTEKVMLGTYQASSLTTACTLYLTWKDWKYLIILFVPLVSFFYALFYIGKLQKKTLREICYQLEHQAETCPDSPGLSKLSLRDTFCRHTSKYSRNYFVWQKILKEVAYDNRIKETTQLLDGVQTIMWESGVST